MGREKVIIDTDPGVDDVLAILFALASSSSELQLLAITTVFGNSTLDNTSSNLLKLFKVLNNQPFPQSSASSSSSRYYDNINNGEPITIAQGADGPLDVSVEEREVAEYFHGPDGLSSISTTHPEYNVSSSSSSALSPWTDSDLISSVNPLLKLSMKEAYEVMLEVLEKEDEGTVTIMALGPLTNLALAYRTNPTIFRRVGRIVWMGAAIDVPGNTTPCAEFNCFADPIAATILLDASSSSPADAKAGGPELRLISLPLDITSPHTIPFPLLIHDDVSDEDVVGRRVKEFTSSFLRRVRVIMHDLGCADEMEMHDICVVWFVINNPLSLSALKGVMSSLRDGWQSRRRLFQIETEGKLTKGYCVVDRRGTNETLGEIRSHGGIHSTASSTVVSTSPALQELQSGVEILIKTPGKNVLQKVFLERVFGDIS